MKKRKIGGKPKKVVYRRLKKKVILLVIDGLADSLTLDTTPLKEAQKPNLDYFAKNGACGQLSLVPKKFGVWSHIANASLLGYNPERFYLKRGPLESVGADLPYKEGHLALRCNFATVDKDLTVTDRRAGRNIYGLDEIARYINEHVDMGVPFILKRTYGHRAVLIIKMSLSDQITTNDPYRIGERVKRISGLNNEAIYAAKIVQEFIDKAHNIMEYHESNAKRIDKDIPPANYILVRDAGNRLQDLLPHFTKKHNIKATCVAENGVMKATCMLAGFNAINIPEITTDGKISFERTLNFIFENVDNALSEYNLVYAHIKGPDEASHDGDFERKKEMIEAIDERLEQFRNFDGILIVTADHVTSTEEKKHMHGNVPVLVYGKGKDKVQMFDEFAVKKGKLKIMNGSKLWKYVLGK